MCLAWIVRVWYSTEHRQTFVWQYTKLYEWFGTTTRIVCVLYIGEISTPGERKKRIVSYSIGKTFCRIEFEKECGGEIIFYRRQKQIFVWTMESCIATTKWRSVLYVVIVCQYGFDYSDQYDAAICGKQTVLWPKPKSIDQKIHVLGGHASGQRQTRFEIRRQIRRQWIRCLAKIPTRIESISTRTVSSILNGKIGQYTRMLVAQCATIGRRIDTGI